MRVAVVGAGGIGGYFGGRLAAAGADVAFLARGAHLEALRRHGLRVRSDAGDFSVPRVRASDDPGELGVPDVVLVAVKTWQLDAVLETLAPMVGPDTAVVTTQNGVEAPDRVAAVFGRPAVIPGTAKIFANIEEPGVIRHLGELSQLTFGEWDNGVTPRVDQLRSALGEAGVQATVPADIWAALWSKFLFVVPFGGLGAATGAPIGVLRSRPGTRKLLVALMREIRDLATDRGVRLPEDVVETSLAFVDQQPESGRTSLQRDIWAGRPSELEAWTGAVVRLAAASGVATPVHDTLYELLAARVGSVS